MRFSFNNDGVPKDKREALRNITAPYRIHLNEILTSSDYTEPESSIRLPSDNQIFSSVEDMYREKVKSPLKFVVVIGIGGSSLGTKAVYDALIGYKDGFREDKNPQMVFFDTNDQNIIDASLVHILNNVSDKSEILIVIISKSGTTTETIANSEYLVREFKIKIPDIEERVVSITGEGSPLWKLSEAHDISKLQIPKSVGGRYSVFSAVGLFPLMAVGISVEEFCAGALLVREECLSPKQGSDPAELGAIFLGYWRKNGKTIHDTFFFSPELESLGKWYRQLLGESIGKSEESGITPTVSIGTTDLHSVGQLYLGGPKDKTTLFVSVAGRTGLFNKMTESAFFGTEIAYEKHGLPFDEVVFDGITARELGAFMQWKIIETMYLGKLLSVNAFDQPDVESYKQETAKIFGKL